MPLDPQVRALLDQTLAAGFLPTHQLSVAEARDGFLARRAMIPGPSEPVGQIIDRTIDGPETSIPIRIYRPASDVALPILVYFHGGGWVIGSIQTHDGTSRALANRGRCIVISVEYRLAPESRFPAAPEDCYAATVWAAEHAASVGGDASRLAVGGDSAGGNLAAAVALMARDRGGPRLAFQLLIYPVTDCAFETPSYRANAEGYGLGREDMRWFWQHYLGASGDPTHPYASPLRAADLAGLPPALVITAEYDPLRDEGVAYAERLRAAGVEAELLDYAGMNHGFCMMPSVLSRTGVAFDAIEQSLQARLWP